MKETEAASIEKKYLRSAIEKIYGEEDDFILIGLTGRTGSGCTTAANILGSEFGKINHDLKKTTDGLNNDKRKERIVRHFIETNWRPFEVIRVSSIMLLLLAEDPNGSSQFTKEITHDKKKANLISKILSSISRKSTQAHKANEGITALYCDQLPRACKWIRSIAGAANFTEEFQRIGKNLRQSGSVYGTSKEAGRIFCIAEKINFAAKLIHKEKKSKRLPTHIAIDAIRNPLEALFFQDRYASFYLISITSDEDQRRDRLRKIGYADNEIQSIDSIEYRNYDAGEAASYSNQDIQGCIQKSDIHIRNEDAKDSVSKFQELTNQLLKFVALIKRPGLITPSAVERCMQIAHSAKLNSGCISRQVGAVATDHHYSIKSIGWNDAPHGQVPCNLRCRGDLTRGKDPDAYSDYEKNNHEYLKFFRESSSNYDNDAIKNRGLSKSFCFKSEYNKHTGEKNQVHTRSLHAEENAFLQLSKYGSQGIEGGKLFTTASPCELCSKKASQLGIKEIYYIDPYPGISISHVISSGTMRPSLILFTGAIGRAFHRLYSPVFPYKDELSALASD